jgi:O-antigen/teichoic acid export membrane protein
MSSPESPRTSLTARTSWLIVGKTLGFVFTAAIPLLLVRRMPRHEFGLYKQLFLVINSAVTMLPLGFGMSAFYFLPREAERRAHAVFNIVLFTTAVATLFGAVLAIFPSTLILLFKEPAAVEFAPWIAVIALLWLVGSFLEIVTVANHEIRTATAAIVGVQMTRASFFLVAAAASGTIRSVLVAAVCQGIVQVTVLLAYLTSRFPRFWRAFDLAFFRRQLTYALPFGLAGLFYSLQTDVHYYFVSHRFGPAVYAIYSIGCFQLPLFGILAESVGAVMIPRFSALQGIGDRREMILTLARAMRKLALVYFPAYAFLLVMRREVVVALFTPRYLESVPVFAVNLTLIPLGALLLDPVMRAHAAHRHFLVQLHAAILVCLMVALPLAIGRFGLVGAIVLVVVSNAAGRLATLVKTVSILRMERRDVILFADLARTAGIAALAGLATTIARSYTVTLPAIAAVAACGVCFSLIYVATAIITGIVTDDERAMVLDRVWRLTGLSPRVAAPTVTTQE